MKITLYKNCCLNNKYQEVFYNTKLETYLNSLTKLSFTLNDVYYENNMEVVFDYEIFTREGLVIRSDNVYDFNYAKIEENVSSILTPDLVRYCFIKNIEVKNGVVYLETEEDIWASYSAKMQGTNVCNLTNSRRTAYGTGMVLSPLKIPYNYDGNNKLNIKKLPNITYGKCYAIAQIQYYKLSASDEIEGTDVGFFILGKGSGQIQSALSISDIVDDYDRIIEGVMRFINYVPTTKYLINNEEYNYTIGEIYIVPEWFNIKAILEKNIQDDTKYNVFGYWELGSLYVGRYLVKCDFTKSYDLQELVSITIANNYKNISFGPLSNQLKLINNGSSIVAKLLGCINNNGFTLMLNYQNQLIDITKDFEYIAPIELIDSATYQQRKISLTLKNRSYDFSIFETAMGISDDQNKIVGNIGQAIGGFKTGNMSAGFGGAMGAVSALHDTIIKGVEIGKLVGDKELVNAPMYSNAKGVFKNNAFFLNYVYGVFISEIDADNKQFVKDFVDNFGYDSFYFINSQAKFEAILKTDLYNQENFHYNVIKISSPNVYGSFTNDIANVLNQILETGVKIWYDATKTEDPYTNGLLS